MNLVNIFNHRRTIYLFCRDENGKLEIRTKNNFFPYFFEPDNEGNCISYNGIPLRKVLVSEPRSVPKQRSDNSFEADILFTKRYMIDKIETLDKCSIKYSFIDIEVLADELPNVQKAKHTISCISVYNSFSKLIQTFYLPDYETEYKMLEKFIEYMKKEQFDLWLSWNVKFDYNYLYNRIPDFAEKISIIGKSRYGDGDVFYPAGISIVDYLGWFKKVTLNRDKSYALDKVAQKHLKEEHYEMPEFGKLSIEVKNKNIHDVKRMMKLEEKFKIISYYDEVRRLAKVEWEDMTWNSRTIDMLLLQEAKNQKVVLPMKPDERRGTLSEKEQFEGAFREAFKTGAFFNSGAYDLSSAYPSMIIDFNLDPANICQVPIGTPTKEGDLRIENSVFRQNEKVLLPIVVKKLMTIKVDIKKKLSTLELNSPEYKDMKIKYDAIKSIVNSAYGVFGNRFFRLYNKKVASATTFLVRDLLHYIIDKLKEKGHEVIYVDTDGIIIKNNNTDLSDMLNQFIKQWAKEKYNKENITTEFNYEGYYEKLLILAKCRYVGHLKTNRGIEKKIVGVESRRKDSTIFMRKFLTELIDKILNKYHKDNIIEWIKLQIEKVKDIPLHEIAFPCKLGRKPEEYKSVPIFLRALRNTPDFEKKVGSPFYYIYVKPTGYETELVEKNLIQTYDKEGNEKGFKNITEKRLGEVCKQININYGDRIRYAKKMNNQNAEEEQIMNELKEKGLYKTEKIEVKGKSKDVIAFDEENNKHITKDMVDWEMIKQRNILMKLTTIFEAMKWDLSEVIRIETKQEIKPKYEPKTLKTTPISSPQPQNKEIIADTAVRPKETPKPPKKTKIEEIKPFYEE